jgi:dTDP-glucose 4,6-dehydratase
MYAQTRDWPIAGAMIFQAYGPWQPAHTLVQAAVRAALAGEDFPMTAGKQKRDWIYVGDVAAGIEAGLNADLKPGTTFELGTGKATPVVDVVRLIYQLSEEDGKPQIGTLPSRPGENLSQIASAGATKKLIAWQPSTTLEEGLERTIQHIATG